MSQVFLESVGNVTSSRVIKDFGHIKLIVTIHVDMQLLTNVIIMGPSAFFIHIQPRDGFIAKATSTFKETYTVNPKHYESLVSKVGKEVADFMVYGDVYGALDHARLEQLIAGRVGDAMVPFLVLCKNPSDYPKQIEHWKKHPDKYVTHGGKLSDLEPVAPKTYYRHTNGPVDWSYVIKETELGIFEVKLLEQFNQAKEGDTPVPFNVDFIPFDDNFRAKDLERIKSVCPTMGVHLNAIRKYGHERLDWIIKSNLIWQLDSEIIDYKFGNQNEAKSVSLLLLVADPLSFNSDIEYWSNQEEKHGETPSVISWAKSFKKLDLTTKFK